MEYKASFSEPSGQLSNTTAFGFMTSEAELLQSGYWAAAEELDLDEAHFAPDVITVTGIEQMERDFLTTAGESDSKT